MQRNTAALAFLAVTSTTVAGLAAVDLVLPAVPALPGALGGDAARAQYVLAAFTAGIAAGFLLSGIAGDRWPRLAVLRIGTLLLALTSLAGAAAPSLDALVGLRLVQGLAAAAGAVVGPALLRGMLDERGAIRAMSTMGSIESLTPAFAPILGAWLLAEFGWRASFHATAALAFAAFLGLLALRVPESREAPAGGVPGGYGSLLRSRRYMVYAASHALMFGAMLGYVFSLPALFTGPMGGGIRDFILVQIVQVALFILGAQLAAPLSARLGPDRLIALGAAGNAAGGAALLALALAPAPEPLWTAAAMAPFFLGMGLRGGAGVVRAMDAAGAGAARGMALLLCLSLGAAAAATAGIAPWLALGPLPLAVQVLALALLSLATLAALPRRAPVSPGRVAEAGREG